MAPNFNFKSILMVRLLIYFVSVEINSVTHPNLWEIRPRRSGGQQCYFCISIVVCDLNYSIKVFICVFTWLCLIFILFLFHFIYVYQPRKVNWIDSTMNLHKIKSAIKCNLSYLFLFKDTHSSEWEWERERECKKHIENAKWLMKISTFTWINNHKSHLNNGLYYILYFMIFHLYKIFKII